MVPAHAGETLDPGLLPQDPKRLPTDGHPTRGTPLGRSLPINAITQSEVPQRMSLRRSRKIRAGHFRLRRLNEAAGVWGRRGPLLEFESIFHWKSLPTGLFYEHSKYGASLNRLPLLNRERKPIPEEARPTGTRSVCRASGFVQTPQDPAIHSVGYSTRRTARCSRALSSITRLAI